MVPGFCPARRHHAARRDLVRREQPPYRRDVLQGPRARLASGVDYRSRAKRPRALDQGHTHRLKAEHAAPRSVKVKEATAMGMSVYTIHEPPDPPADRLDRADSHVFVKEGFTWTAALFTPFWLIA